MNRPWTVVACIVIAGAAWSALIVLILAARFIARFLLAFFA
jgi:hypothetical protein